MSNLRPENLVLRCYGHKKKDGRWYGVCIDLNLAAEADDRDQLIIKIGDMIKSYLSAVYDTDDRESIPELLRRKAPISDRITYYFFKAMIFIRNFPDNFTFIESIPCNVVCNS